MFQLALLAFEQSMNVKTITFYVKSLELLVIQPFDKPLKRKTIINYINCAGINLNGQRVASTRNAFDFLEISLDN